MSKNEEPLREPGPAHQRLASFVGRWNTAGTLRATADRPAAGFHATDEYEWLPGGFFLVHRWDAQMPDGPSQGIEVIGFDAAKGSYTLHSFDSQGGANVMRGCVERDEWSFDGQSVRFRGSFRHHGRTFAGTWERRSPDGHQWLPWMDVTLSRADPGSSDSRKESS